MAEAAHNINGVSPIHEGHEPQEPRAAHLVFQQSFTKGEVRVIPYVDLPPISEMPNDVLVGDWYVVLASEPAQRESNISVVPRCDDATTFDAVQTYPAPSRDSPPQTVTYAFVLRSTNQYSYTSLGFSGDLLVLSGNSESHLLIGSRSAKHSQLSVISRTPRLDSENRDALRHDCLRLGIDHVRHLGLGY
ncbi:hypothetical protein [Streptomyces sp. NPDC048639]|uniref:hypothetical protein n=1 Tax=Streptomyces sp. NPDC048639 TaxID=3365581 RepID=UPI00371AE099